ncbi:thiamine-phosphate kinase [Ferrovibrio sp.]|uniref:thiamine-phosphate kinase n=1 Tax=Ferrovibrio sp. TaxID=1917215 RepID=UPI003D2A2CA9
MPLGEFELIEKYLAPLSAGLLGAFGLRDDAACLAVPAGQELVLTSDAFVSGIHFLDSDGPERIARKLLRVNLSDLAAKGAKPYAYQLSLGLPGSPEEGWIAAFTAGLAADQAAFGIQLSGGDTVRSPGGLVLSITALGLVPAGGMIRRNGARAGDALFVTGSIGDAWLGLEAKLGRLALTGAAARHCDQRLHLPEPRLGFGRGLRGLANAAMDVSDGLLQDAGHLSRTAGLGAVIDTAAVPLSEPVRAFPDLVPRLLPKLLAGGDDYEILFAAPPEMASAIQALGEATATPVTRIGAIVPEPGLWLQDAAGQRLLLNQGQGSGGYQHF